MNSAATILTSVVVSAVVASIFNLFAQATERRARRKELIFLKALELAKANREFVMAIAEKTGKGAELADYVVYAEGYYWLLTELHDKGALPDGWQQRSKDMMQKTRKVSDALYKK